MCGRRYFRLAYPTNYSTTPATVSDHVSRTKAIPAASDAVDPSTTASICGPGFGLGLQQSITLLRRPGPLIAAVKRQSDEHLPILEQIGSDLATCS
jgi:hypothetical protein